MEPIQKNLKIRKGNTKDAERQADLADIRDIPNLFRRYNIDRENGRGNYELYCQEFGYSVIYGNLQYANLDKILALVNLEQLPDYMLLVRVDEYIDIFQHFPDFNNYSIKGNIMAHLEDTLNSFEIRYVLSNYKGTDMIGIFLCMGREPDAEEETVSRELSRIAEKLIENVRAKTNVYISITISGYCSSLTRFPRRYEECKNAFWNIFRKGRGSYTFCVSAAEEKRRFERERFQDDLAELIACMEKKSWPEVEQAIEKIVGYLEETYSNPTEVKLHATSLVQKLRDTYQLQLDDKHDLDMLFFDSFEKVLRCSYMEDIRRILQNLLKEIFRQQDQMTMSSDERLRFQIDGFIGRFYSQPDFSLGMLAELNHYNPEHFSQVFKRLYQISFSQYLAGYRIEKAKSFLRNGNLSLGEIADRVGFGSTSYFCTVFKNRTGMSPKQFLTEEKKKK